MCDPVTATFISLGVTTATQVGMGIANSYNASAQAQASLNAQAQAQQASLTVSNAQASQQMAMQRLQMQQQQNQFLANQQQQVQQQQANQRLQIQQQFQQMQQTADLQAQQQTLQIQQQQDQQRLQQDQLAQQRNLQMAQANREITERYKNAKSAVLNERAQIMQKNQVDRRIYEQERITAALQKDENLSAANRVYIAEQQKLSDKRKEAAFEAQAIMAKAIGAKGTILASGRTGQSIGLLLKDVDRQAGFAIAQENAMLDSAEVSALIGMDQAFEQNRAADRKAALSIGFNPDMPYLPKLPEVPDYLSLGIPT